MSEKKTKKEVKETIAKKKVVKKETPKKVEKKEEIKEEKIVEVKEKKKRTRVKKEEKKALLPQKEQRILKALSRIITIIAKIIRVCAMIITPIIAIVIILIPIVFKQVEIRGNIVKFNDIRFVINDDYVTANIGDKTYLLADDIKDVNKIVDFLNSDSVINIMISVELTLLYSAIILIIDIYLLNYVIKLFDNFYKQKTPFIKENADYIHSIARAMIYSLITTVIFEAIITLVSKNVMTINFTSFSIISILVVYIIYYIFLYAANLQDKTDSVIYD